MLFSFTSEARAQLRAIDHLTALWILRSLSRFGETAAGSVEVLHGEWQGCFRLRIGDYRAAFRYITDGIEIVAVGHRSDIYK